MDKKGQATVEFALVALLLSALLFAIIDLAYMCYVNLTMQEAVREGARYAVTGQGGATQASLIQKIRDSSNGLYDENALPEKDPTISILTPTSTQSFSNYSGSPVTNGTTGQPNQIIIVSLTYAWPLMTPVFKPFFADGQNYVFTVRATMKNENWGQ